MTADPTVGKAQTHWSKHSREERESALARILDLFTETYELRERPKLVFEDIPGSAARYDPASNTITINPTTDKFSNGRSFTGTIMGTMVEEAFHAYQFQITRDYMEKRLREDDPRYRQGRLFALNLFENMYLRDPEYWTAYSRQPLERFAKGLQVEIYNKVPMH